MTPVSPAFRGQRSFGWASVPEYSLRGYPRYMRVVVIAALVFALAGCTINDPTDDTFSARFRNNLGYDAKIGMCSNEGTCRGGLQYVDSVKRGQSISLNISSNGYIQPFRITASHGRVVGCLFLVAAHYRRNLTIPLRRMTACPGKIIRLP